MGADIRLDQRGARRVDEPEVTDAQRRGDDTVELEDDRRVRTEDPHAEFTPDAVVAASGEGLAGRMQARRERALHVGPKTFAIPGWDGDLEIVARPYARRKDLVEGVAPEKFIIGATQELRYRDGPDGDWETIPGKWGKGLAAMMGVTVDSASALVRAVFSRPVDGEWVENPVAIDAFAVELMGWMEGRSSEVDEQLGEP